MAPRVRGLTISQAIACEQALEDRCRCRCGGLYHGSRRVGLGFDPESYLLLPEDDPHHAQEPKNGWQLTMFDHITGALNERLLGVGDRARALVPIPDPDL